LPPIHCQGAGIETHRTTLRPDRAILRIPPTILGAPVIRGQPHALERGADR
jgi:hypothetical protein